MTSPVGIPGPQGRWADGARRSAAMWALAWACLAVVAGPVARGAGLEVELEPSVEVSTVKESGPWSEELLREVRRHAATPLTARATLRLKWADTFTWPGQAEGASDVSLAVRLSGDQTDGATQAVGQVKVERARFSWLVPGGVLQVGRFEPVWGKGFVHQPSSPFHGMREAPYSLALTWAGDEAVAEVGWAHSAERPYRSTEGPDPEAEVAWVRLSASEAFGEGALAFGHRTGMGPWLSAQLARPVGDGWQLYGEGILARPYRPVQVAGPESSPWSFLKPSGYGADPAVRWLAGAWYLSPSGWSVVLEYRYEPGGLDDREADAFWKAASGQMWGGLALWKLAGLAEDRLALRRRYLDWALAREGIDSNWSWRVGGTLNLDDGSRSWAPQVSYRVREGATVGLRLTAFEGPSSTEYGATPIAWNVELTLTGLLD